jgi:N6-L-threonylcarbamoyladenine synthase
VLVLGIESSCDETGLALYDTEAGLLADALHSQMDMHRDYGGVVPELASRDHIRRLVPLLSKVLQDSGHPLSAIDCIAVTQGPGLGGALLTGAGFAAALGAALDKPVLGVHHLEGHLLSPMLGTPAPVFPFVALLVSGGHTQLMAVTGVGEYRLLGETIDDAAGEAFDKTASLLGLGYPGGAALSRLAEAGNASQVSLPRPMLHSKDLDFSFSGLKTAVAQVVNRSRDASGMPDDATRADIAASFEAAIVDVLVAKSLRALEQEGMSRLVVAGGVGANQQLRKRLTNAAAAVNAEVFYPPLALCTDNGAMIAFAAGLRLEAGLVTNQFSKDGAFLVRPRWGLEERPAPAD